MAVIEMTVGDVDVGPAVEVVVEEEAAEAEREQDWSGRPSEVGATSTKRPLLLVVVERDHLVGKIGDEQAGVAGAVVVGGVDAHAGARHAVFAVGDAGGDALLSECAVAVVDVELVGLGVVADGDVGPAVLVGVEDGDAEALGGGIVEAGLFRHVGEGAVAVVVPEADRCAGVGLRRAVGLGLAVHGAVEVFLGRPLDVVGDEQVEPAVAVVIDPGGAGAELGRE